GRSDRESVRRTLRAGRKAETQPGHGRPVPSPARDRAAAGGAMPAIDTPDQPIAQPPRPCLSRTGTDRRRLPSTLDVATARPLSDTRSTGPRSPLQPDGDPLPERGQGQKNAG